MAIDVKVSKRSRSPGARMVAWVRHGGISTFLFFVPLLICFGYFAWWPIIKSFLLSLQHTNLLDAPTWVGLDNFARILSDPLLGTAILNTVWFAALAILLGFPLPVFFATLMAELRRTRQIASVLVYMPVIIPPVVSVLLWKQFYDPSPDGLFNTMLGWVGLGPFPWLQDGASAMPSIVLQVTWATFGQATIIYIAALMSIQTELYEAAEIDGASIFHRFWHVTLPQLRTIMLLLLLLQLVSTLHVFTDPFVMTGGGPNNQTVTVLMLVYRYAFTEGDFGKATALSVLLAAGLAIISFIYLRLTRSWSKTS